LKRLFVSGTYMSPLVTKGLKIPKQTRKQKHTFRVSQGSVSTVIIPRVAGSLSSSFSRWTLLRGVDFLLLFLNPLQKFYLQATAFLNFH